MQEQIEISNRLGNDRIGRLLVRYSLPAITSMAAMSLYNVIGSIFIGRGIGPLALSAMGVTFPLMNIVFAFSLVVGAGGAASASILMGRKRLPLADKVLGNVIFLNFISAFTLCIISIPFLDEILILFGASDATLGFAKDYMIITILGAPLTFSMFNLNHVMRASGYPFKAMISVVFSVVVNTILTPIFIFVLDWGMYGAALATILSQAASLIWVLSHFFRKSSLLHFKRGIYKPDFGIIKRIISIGVSPFIINICGCLVVVFINTALKKYEGDFGIGAFGIVNRVLMLFAMVVVGLGQGMQPIVGYNYGAKKFDRVRKTVNRSILIGTIITSVGAALCIFIPEFITGMFISAEFLKDASAVHLLDISARGLTVAGAMFPFVGGAIIIQQFFQFIGRAQTSIILSVLRQMVVLVPLIVILPHFLGAFGVWVSMPIADFSSSLISFIVFFKYVKGIHMRDQK